MYSVFQLGLFPRAPRPARTVLRPARFTRALPELKKKKLQFYFFYFYKMLLLFLCFQSADVKMLVKCLQICAHKIVPKQHFVRVLDCDQILVIRALNCARFCVVCALNCARILVVRTLDCAQFLLHLALFQT